MNRIIASIIFAATLTLLAGGCSSDPPGIRVRNENAAKVNVQCKPASGNTINVNDVGAGATTAWQKVPEVRWDVSATLSSSNDAPTASMTTVKGTDYTIVVLGTTPATIRIDSQDQ